MWSQIFRIREHGWDTPRVPDYGCWQDKGVNSVGWNLSELLAGRPHLSVRSPILALCSRVLAQSHGEASAPDLSKSCGGCKDAPEPLPGDRAALSSLRDSGGRAAAAQGRSPVSEGSEAHSVQEHPFPRSMSPPMCLPVG